MLDLAAQHLIATALADTAGQHGLWVSAQPRPELTASGAMTWVESTPQRLLSTPWQQRHDLAIAWLAGDLPWRDALHVLSALRDLHARQLLAFVPVSAWQQADSHWQPDQLRALGLQQQARFEQDGELVEAWSFDIRTYKAVPDWLNPRFWANPENWNKYRW